MSSLSHIRNIVENNNKLYVSVGMKVTLPLVEGPQKVTLTQSSTFSHQILRFPIRL